MKMKRCIMQLKRFCMAYTVVMYRQKIKFPRILNLSVQKCTRSSIPFRGICRVKTIFFYALKTLDTENGCMGLHNTMFGFHLVVMKSFESQKYYKIKRKANTDPWTYMYQRWNRVSRRSKHPLSSGLTRRVEISIIIKFLVKFHYELC